MISIQHLPVLHPLRLQVSKPSLARWSRDYCYKKRNRYCQRRLNHLSVSAGDIIFVLPGQLHAISQKDNEIMEYENILFKSSLLKSSGYDLCNDKFIQPLFSGSLNICPVINNQTPYYPPVITAINEIDHLCDLRPYAYQLSIKAHLFQILYTLVSNCGQNKIKPNQPKNLSKK